MTSKESDSARVEEVFLKKRLTIILKVFLSAWLVVAGIELISLDPIVAAVLVPLLVSSTTIVRLVKAQTED